MSKFQYALRVGQYQEPIYVDINLTIEGGLNQEDYEVVRGALKLVEDIALEYQAREVKKPKGGTK